MDIKFLIGNEIQEFKDIDRILKRKYDIALMDGGHEVYVITSVSESINNINMERIEASIDRCSVAELETTYDPNLFLRSYKEIDGQNVDQCIEDYYGDLGITDTDAMYALKEAFRRSRANKKQYTVNHDKTENRLSKNKILFIASIAITVVNIIIAFSYIIFA